MERANCRGELVLAAPRRCFDGDLATATQGSKPGQLPAQSEVPEVVAQRTKRYVAALDSTRAHRRRILSLRPRRLIFPRRSLARKSWAPSKGSSSTYIEPMSCKVWASE